MKTKQANKLMFLTRIKNTWMMKDKKFKITYLSFLLVLFLLVALWIWSLVVVDQTRREAFDYFSPLYQQEVDSGTISSSWVQFIIDKFQGDVTKYSWLCASSSSYNSLSSVCYVLCPITCLISAPLLVYYITSFLIVAFPKKSKEEKLLIKESKQKKKRKGGKK